MVAGTATATRTTSRWCRRCPSHPDPRPHHLVTPGRHNAADQAAPLAAHRAPAAHLAPPARTGRTGDPTSTSHRPTSATRVTYVIHATPDRASSAVRAQALVSPVSSAARVPGSRASSTVRVRPLVSPVSSAGRVPGSPASSADRSSAPPNRHAVNPGKGGRGRGSFRRLHHVAVSPSHLVTAIPAAALTRVAARNPVAGRANRGR